MKTCKDFRQLVVIGEFCTEFYTAEEPYFGGTHDKNDYLPLVNVHHENPTIITEVATVTLTLYFE